MDAGRSLRELFAELSRSGGGDPADLLHAAGFGDVPGPLVAEAIVSYAATAPLEVAEHLSPFVVAHGPVPTVEPPDGAAGSAHGLSLLASAPVVDVPVADHVGSPDPDAHLGGGVPHPVDDVDVDPSALDGPTPHDPFAHSGIGPDGPDHDAVSRSFGGGGEHVHGEPDDGVDHDLAPVLDHDLHVDPDVLGVSRLDPVDPDGVALPAPAHDADTDPVDLLDGDEHLHP